jgi:hypothetical protein
MIDRLISHRDMPKAMAAVIVGLGFVIAYW